MLQEISHVPLCLPSLLTQVMPNERSGVNNHSFVSHSFYLFPCLIPILQSSRTSENVNLCSTSVQHENRLKDSLFSLPSSHFFPDSCLLRRFRSYVVDSSGALYFLERTRKKDKNKRMKGNREEETGHTSKD